tara:strand:- start:615 stop:1232 length:618 start_codon:yes stop_codon:yes gene_type:complete
MAGAKTHSTMSAASKARVGYRFFRLPRPAPLPDKVATREGDRDPIQPLVARRVPHRLPFGISGGVRGDGTLARLAYLSSSSSTGWCVGDHCWCETLCLGVGALRPTFWPRKGMEVESMLWITSAPCRATIALQKLSPSHAVRSTPPSRVGAGSRETLGFRDSARSVPIVRAVPSGGAGSSRAFSAPVSSPGAASSLAVGNDLRKT